MHVEMCKWNVFKNISSSIKYKLPLKIVIRYLQKGLGSMLYKFLLTSKMVCEQCRKKFVYEDLPFEIEKLTLFRINKLVSHFDENSKWTGYVCLMFMLFPFI